MPKREPRTPDPIPRLSLNSIASAHALACHVINGSPKAVAMAKKLRREIEESARETQAYADEIEKARNRYAWGSDDNIEIDDTPLLSIADEGIWVNAWVWVRTSEE